MMMNDEEISRKKISKAFIKMRSDIISAEIEVQLGRRTTY